MTATSSAPVVLDPVPDFPQRNDADLYFKFLLDTAGVQYSVFRIEPRSTAEAGHEGTRESLSFSPQVAVRARNLAPLEGRVTIRRHGHQRTKTFKMGRETRFETGTLPDDELVTIVDYLPVDFSKFDAAPSGGRV